MFLLRKIGRHVTFSRVRAFSQTHLAVPRKKETELDLVYSRVMKTLPKGVEMSFAYGSGVFQQTGHKDMHKNMLDFIVVVDEPFEWHHQNLTSNSHHYSFLKRFGPNALSLIQEVGAGVYFNTLVPFEDRLIKYGVISTDTLIKDLTLWDQLYVSGRLHKPVKFTVSPLNSDIQKALDSNLVGALHTALLLLPEQFSETELYTTITGLSYTGDIRMTIGEDKNKVNNIVLPNLEKFRDLYLYKIKEDENVHYNQQTGFMEQSLSKDVIKFRAFNLPANVCYRMLQNYDYGHDMGHKLEIDYKQPLFEHLLKQKDIKIQVSTAVEDIVRSSSKQQTLLGIAMGGSKSLTYGMKKVKKWLNSTKT